MVLATQVVDNWIVSTRSTDPKPVIVLSEQDGREIVLDKSFYRLRSKRLNRFMAYMRMIEVRCDCRESLL